MTKRNTFWKRALSLALALFLVCGLLPPVSFAEDTDSVQNTISTVDDAETLTRPTSIYADNTINAGKITVGKSVSDDTVALDADGDGDADFSWDVTDTNNFLVTISQSAQAMGLSTSMDVPVDVVFVLDTSGSMGADNQSGRTGRAEAMVEAANTAIASLLKANEYNRVAVVGFSSASGNRAAANVLSALYHYTGESATKHLRWANSSGTVYDPNNVDDDDDDNNWGPPGGGPGGNNNNDYDYGIRSAYEYILGRAAGTVSAGLRHGGDGGTNIHAGIALGAEQLLNVTDTTVQIGGETVQRMPFIIVLSDGQPTYISQATDGDNGSTATTWYDPTYTNDQGPGNGASGGIGFMTALAAAYFKGAVSDHYYGAAATEEDRCFVYTVGVEMNELTGNNAELANITMDPSTYFDAALNSTDAENYYYDTFNTYWAHYNASPAANFSVDVSNGNYTVTADSITATTNYVHGNRTENGTVDAMYAGGLQYNDGYYNATDISQLAGIFNNLVDEISLKAISSPTKVTGAEEFSGYVTFTDPLGEYMEVKDVKGIVANGLLFQGAGFAQKLVEYVKYMTGTGSTYDAAFAQTFRHVLSERMKLTQSSVEIEDYLEKALASPNQVYYNSSTDYSNSIVWWGRSYTAEGEEDAQMQVLSYAEDDSIAYIESVLGTDAVPANANYVCRSYFFYGTAGGQLDTPVEDFMYFVVRVQRSLTAPYQQTVVISAPASLLSVERVLITESTDDSGNKTYTAKVQEAQPARVVYEVGLQDDINAYNVAQKVSAAYAAEAPVDGVGQANVVGDTYYFFTNDWDRQELATSHHRGMASATFDAAHDNPYYAYTENTYIVDANGNKITSSTLTPGTYYYVREYYDWSADTDGVDANGAYTAVKKQALIEIQISQTQINDESVVGKDSTGWYIVAGNYTAYSISSGHDDYIKQADNDGPAENGYVEAANITGTSNYVAHYHRTEDSSNSHYTVYLGNNGRLALKSIPTKSVSGTSTANPTITIEDGSVVTVGDVLTYSVKVVNESPEAVTADVTDLIPAGTVYVNGSASHGEYLSTVTTAGRVTTLNWNDVPVAAGKVVTITFQVTVDESALDSSVNTINNTASVLLSNGVSYNTNTTHNPPEGKKVLDTTGAVPTGGIQVGQTLVYSIRFYNDEATTQTVTVTDKLPTGTVYVSSDHGGVYDSTTNTVTWTLQVEPGEGGVVTFRAVVDASARTPIENGATIKVGDNDPRVTNTTSTDVLTGDLELSKEIAVASGVSVTVDSLAATEFTLVLRETGTDLTGDYSYTVDGTLVENDKITFTAGVSENITIKHGQKIRILGLPAGATLIVTETAKAGYTPTYTASDRVTVAEGAVVNVKVTNTYSPAAAHFQLSGTKTLDTTYSFPATTFTFTSQACSATGVVADGAVTVTAQATVSSDQKTDSFSFPARSFDNVGTYYYLVKETANDTLTGVTFDETVYLLTVTVEDDGSGQLKAAWTLAEQDSTTGAFGTPVTGASADFTNSYAPKETELTLEGSKTVTNRTNQTEGEFSFVVKEGNATVTTGWNKADGSIYFLPITYTTTGEHTYTVSEVPGANNKIQYSSQSYTVKVSVVDNGGQLHATVTEISGSGSSLSFTNVYTPDPAQLTLTGTKTLTNSYQNADRTLQAGEFTFRVDEVDKEGNVKTANVTFGTNAAAAAGTPAAIAFETVTVTYQQYQAAQVESDGNRYLYFKIYEVHPGVSADPTVTYDATEYFVKVPVGLNTATGVVTVGTPQYVYYTLKDGAQGDSSEDYDKHEVSTAAFQNDAFNPPEEGAQAVIEATKTLTGRDMAANEFTFHLYLVSDSLSIAEPGFVAAAHNTAAAAGSAGAISFTRTYAKDALGANLTTSTVRTLTYEIREVMGSAAGVEYDTDVFTVTVTLTYDGEGKIQASVSYPNDVKPAFENTYTAQPTSYTPEGTKVLIGAGGNAIGVSSQFSFEVVELIPVVDAATGTITGFTDGEDVALGHTTGTDGTISFGSIRLSAAGDYYYRIQEVIGSAHGVTYDAKPLYLKIVVTDNTATGELEAVATYYTDSAFTTEATAKQFVNHYGPGEVNFDLTLNKEVKTSVSGRNYNRYLKGDEFDFEVYRSDAAGTIGALVTYGENGPSTDSNGDGAYEPAAITFGTIRFTRGDAYENGAVVTGTPSSQIHYFAVKEIAPRAGSMPGITADSKIILVQIKVSDDGYGNMTAQLVSPTTAEGKTFTNIYEPADTTVTVIGEKQLSGKAWQNEIFSFTLSGGNLDEDVTVKNNADGSISFPISFTSDDLVGATYDNGIYYKDYTFKLVENQTQPENGNANGTYGFDLNVRTIKVRLYDDGSGQLKTQVSYQNAGNDVNEIIFVNPYTPKSITADLTEQIDADKAVDAKDGVTDYSKAGFTFQVTDLQGAPVIGADGTAVQGVSLADGTIKFDTFKFETYGWYFYNITEVAPNAGEEGYKPGMTYDETVWNLRILVEYNEANGALEVKTVQMYKDETDAQSEGGEDIIEFTNVYDPESVAVELVVGKELTGRKLEAGEFQFRIAQAVNGGLILVDEESNDAEGNVTFHLTMDAVGTYTYKIYEVIPTDAEGNKKDGVTYNTATLSVTITVKDLDKNGQLEAYIGDTLIADGAGTAASDVLVLRNKETGAFTITNKYAPAAAHVDIYAFKSLDGKDLAEGVYTFELVDAQGNVVKTATNAADGTVVFENVEVTAAGETTYTIREKEGTDTNTDYDDAAYQVTIKAEDDGKGKLNVTVTYGEDNKVPTFYNVFNPDKITVTLEGTKTLTGRKQEAGEFSFTVYDSTGKKVSSGTNDADGKITFDKIGLPVAGKYTFTVVEEKGTAKGVTYDETKFTVTVEVVNDNGVLKATTTYPEGGIAFENTYTAPPSETPETGDTTPIMMLALLAVLSLAAMAVLLVLLRRRRAH